MPLNAADFGFRALAQDAFGDDIAPAARRRAWAIISVGVLVVIGLAFVFQQSRNIFGLDLRIYRDAVISTFRDHKPLYGTEHERERLPFTYPPFALLWLSPLALLPVAVGAVVVMVAGFAVCAAVYETVNSRLALTARRRVLVGAVIAAAMFTDPFRLTFGFGQVNFALFLLVFIDVFWLPARWRGVGVGVAAAVKLTPMFFLVYFIWRRQWRAVAIAIVAFLVCTGAAELVVRGSVLDYVTWMHEHSGDIGSPAYVSNQSLAGLTTRLWPASSPQSWMWKAACIAAVAVCVHILRRLRAADVLDQLLAFTVVALTGLLVSPISWSHHWIVIVLVGVVTVLWPDVWVNAAAAVLWAAALLGVMWAAQAPPAGFIHGWFGYAVVANAVSWSAIGFLVVTALRLRKLHDPGNLPARDQQHQRPERRS